MEVTFFIQSLLPPKPGQPDTWPLVAERVAISHRRPDYVLLNEVEDDWARSGKRLDERAAEDLEMGLLSPASPASGKRCVVLYNPDTVGEPVDDLLESGALHEDRSWRTLHGWATGWWRLPVGSGAAQREVLIGVCSFKFTPFSLEAAVVEAGYAATHSMRGGEYAFMGGDVNFSPADPRNGEPNWTNQRPYNRGSRAVPGTARNENPEADRSVARKLIDKGWDDPAFELAMRTGNHAILRHTSLSDYDRIDAGHCTPPLTGALTHYQTLDEPVGASNHHGLVYTFDLELADPHPMPVVWN